MEWIVDLAELWVSYNLFWVAFFFMLAIGGLIGGGVIEGVRRLRGH